MRLTRREFAATTALAGVGLAGCLGEESGDFALEGEDALPVPIAGDPDADVTVMVFEDFGCGACQSFHLNSLPILEEEYIEPGLIRYEHRDFPIPADSTWSWPVASAARSVQDQEGDEAFWEFSSAIFEHLGEYSYDVIESVANDLGFDGEQVRLDAEEEAYRDGLETERGRAEDAGISATPTVVVDGSIVEEDLDQAIEDALE